VVRRGAVLVLVAALLTGLLVAVAGTGAEARPTASSGAPNQPPVGVDDHVTAISGQALVRSAPGVLGNDTDADGQALTASIVTGAQHGLASLQPNGAFTYTGDAGFSGYDFFVYRAFDGVELSDPVHVWLTVMTPNEAYVTAIYEDFLDRVPEVDGRYYWSGRLDRGVETRTSFVRRMSRSHEYAVKIVKRAFTDVLGRAVDPSGREYWANRVQARMPIATLVLELTASNEYLTRSGGTNAGFVDTTFPAILGRPPTAAERSARIAQLDAGGSRLAMVRGLYASVESRQRRTSAQFQLLLGRNPTAAERNEWVARLATTGDADLAIALGASDEYVANALQL